MRILPGSVGVACSPILSVNLEEVSCEPALNLAANPDEAEYNMYCLLTKLYLQLFWEKLMYVSYTTDQPGSSVGHPAGALAIICLWVL